MGFPVEIPIKIPAFPILEGKIGIPILKKSRVFPEKFKQNPSVSRQIPGFPSKIPTFPGQSRVFPAKSQIFPVNPGFSHQNLNFPGQSQCNPGFSKTSPQCMLAILAFYFQWNHGLVRTVLHSQLKNLIQAQ